MNALARITRAGFDVWLKDNGNLGIKPFDALTNEQLEYLKTHKAEIVKELAATSTPATDDHENIPLISKLAEADSQKILAWLSHICETDQEMIDETLSRCSENPETLAYFLMRSRQVIDNLNTV